MPGVNSTAMRTVETTASAAVTQMPTARRAVSPFASSPSVTNGQTR